MIFPVKFLTPLVAFVLAAAVQSNIALANDDTSRQAECAALLEETDSAQQEAICTALKNVAPAEASQYVDLKTGDFDYGSAREVEGGITAKKYELAWERAYADALAETA